MRPIIVSLFDKAIRIAGTILVRRPYPGRVRRSVTLVSARRRGRSDSVAQSLNSERGEDRDGGDYCI
jgi:hypothetical protein